MTMETSICPLALRWPPVPAAEIIGFTTCDSRRPKCWTSVSRSDETMYIYIYYNIYRYICIYIYIRIRIYIYDYIYIYIIYYNIYIIIYVYTYTYIYIYTPLVTKNTPKIPRSQTVSRILLGQTATSTAQRPAHLFCTSEHRWGPRTCAESVPVSPRSPAGLWKSDS